MTRIGRVGGGPAAPAASPGRVAASAGGFSVGTPAGGAPDTVASGGGAPETAAAGGALATAALAELLQMQEAGPGGAATGAAADRQARSHGRDILAALAALQRDLLGSGEAGSTLARLGALIAAAPVPADPALAETMRAVVLRARIEVARRQQG